MTSRIALGAVQFGLAYGITNADGQVPRDEVARILNHSRKSGIDVVDTAIAYGSSEEVLGEAGMQGWRVVSKLPAVPDACHDVGAWVEEQVAASLTRLRTPTLYGLLLHRPEQLLGPLGKDLLGALKTLRARGVVQQIGVSVYAPSELDKLVSYMPFDLVQAPFNVLDRRMATSGWLDRLRNDGCEFHARSVFLQGLLLMPQDARPAWFDRWQALWQAWDGWLAETSQTPLQACLRHALAQREIDQLVVGVTSVDQLQEILAAAQGDALPLPSTLLTEDPVLLNPALWNRS
jgi:aryl-alcohol dehydrogenase-like predicted oxidoreductase